MVKQIQNGKPFTILIMENKHTSYASQSSFWLQALVELTEYLNMEREITKPRLKFQIKLITIERYVRFYWHKGDDDLQNYSNTNSKDYQIKDDKVEVQEILLKIKEKTQKK